MKIALSGANGFIGKAIQRLIEAEYVPISQELLYSPDNLAKFFAKEKPDWIIHAAAYGNHASQTNPAMTVFANIIGTFNMLHAANPIDYKKFIYIGSSSEYGLKDYPMKETDISDPMTFYGASKLGATLLARTFAREYGKPIIIIRPFSVYGDGEASFRFIPTAIKSIMSGEEMNLEPSAIHDWIYIEDFVNGLKIAAENAKDGEIVNIGNGRPVTNIQVIQALENVTGKKIKYKQAEKMRKNDSQLWVADISKLMGYGWRGKFPLGLGLAKTVEYYKVNDR